MRPKPAHPVQEDFDFLFTFFYLIFIYYYLFIAILEVFSFNLVLENKCDCSPHKSALSCLCYMFSVLVLDFYVTSCLPWCL